MAKCVIIWNNRIENTRKYLLVVFWHWRTRKPGYIGSLSSSKPICKICVPEFREDILYYNTIHGLYSLSGKTSYCQISWISWSLIALITFRIHLILNTFACWKQSRIRCCFGYVYGLSNFREFKEKWDVIFSNTFNIWKSFQLYLHR